MYSLGTVMLRLKTQELSEVETNFHGSGAWFLTAPAKVLVVLSFGFSCISV